MARCKRCGKGGLFFKVNADGLCKNCETNQEIKPLILGTASDNNIQVKQNTVPVNQSNALVNYIDRAKIHDDIKDLLWFGDGPFKNYFKDDDYEVLKSFKIGSIEGEMLYRVSLMADEPSLIYTDLPVNKPADISVIPRPPYFPKYYQLTPEQRWIYLNLLVNPYDSNIDIGYVFILYYGLERHLLKGDFEKTFNVILKLRDVHTNKSFQDYSAHALILTSMLHKKGEYALEFLKSLDKAHEFNFSPNLLLILYFSFGVPLAAPEIMRMVKTFEFTNTNYIKKYPNVFLECLNSVIVDKTGNDSIDLKKYFSNTRLEKIPVNNTMVFANSSIVNATVPVPLLCEDFKLKKDMNLILEKAHELTKVAIIDGRKNGTLIEVVKPVEKRTALTQNVVLDKEDVAIIRHKFDRSKIPQGNFTYEDFRLDNNPLIKKHMNYTEEIRESYARRNNGINSLKAAVDACKKQIDISAEVAYLFYAENDFKRKQIEQEYGMTPIEHFRKIRAERGLPPPEDGYDPCGMPEHTGYKQLCIICEKQGFWDEIINIAEQAQKEGWRGDWDKRIEKAKKKLEQGSK